jgi:hypothetical protein
LLGREAIERKLTEISLEKPECHTAQRFALITTVQCEENHVNIPGLTFLEKEISMMAHKPVHNEYARALVIFSILFVSMVEKNTSSAPFWKRMVVMKSFV